MHRFIHCFIVLLITVTCFQSKAQVYELYKGDTINRVDPQMRKQGKWIYFYDDARTKIKMKGEFENNRRVGLWIKYFMSGSRKHEVTYQNGKTIGPARFYYENGYVREEGKWVMKHWVGEYRYYHENGQLSYEFFYNGEGERTGEQNYYYETGDLMITGNWKDGKKVGTLTEYYKDGTVKSEKVFEAGKYKKAESQNFEKGEKPGGEIIKEKSKKLLFTGQYKKIGPTGLLLQRGYFKDGELYNGKWHFYDVNGNRYMTKVLEEKKVIKVIDHIEQDTTTTDDAPGN